MQKDDALRKAKLDFLENTGMLTAHPHFWASFVNIGPAKPLNHKQSNHSMNWWMGGGLILLLLFLLWRYKIRL